MSRSYEAGIRYLKMIREDEIRRVNTKMQAKLRSTKLLKVFNILVCGFETILIGRKLTFSIVLLINSS